MSIIIVCLFAIDTPGSIKNPITMNLKNSPTLSNTPPDFASDNIPPTQTTDDSTPGDNVRLSPQVGRNVVLREEKTPVLS